jgi:hypothetical protein
MKGLIKGAVLALCGSACAGGCYTYRELVDPCYPTRYNHMAREEVHSALVPQVQNGRILEQTVWDYDFEAGTDRLTPGGMELLDQLARRRPEPDTCVFVQTAVHIAYDPENPDKMSEARQDLDAKRVAAVQKYLNARTAGRGLVFDVRVHDPSDPGMPAIFVGGAVQQWLITRPRGGLPTTGVGGGGASVTGGGGVGGAGGGR